MANIRFGSDTHEYIFQASWYYAYANAHTVPTTPPQTYLTLSLLNLGFNTTQTNLLTIPSTVLGGITLLFAGYFSELVNSRVAATIILPIWSLPLLIALYTFNEQTSQWVYFAVVTLITAAPYVHPVQVAWASSNSSSVRTRTVSASIYNMFVQAAAMIGVSYQVNYLVEVKYSLLSSRIYIWTTTR